MLHLLESSNPLRIQIWSYNYDPEPQGIAPLSRMLAMALGDRGHDVLVVAAHPHYPEAAWGTRLKPYRERRDGIPVLRLPIWPGRDTGRQRLRQELSFLTGQALVTPLLPSADVIVAVTPSFPALAPAIARAQASRIPLVMWLQDIVTDGAATTGLLPEGPILDAAQRFERWSYAKATHVVVISEEFRRNLIRKGVPDDKISVLYNPTTRTAPAPIDPVPREGRSPRILAMGNIGHSQGLESIVRAFEANDELAAQDARLIIAGGGVAVESVRSTITTDRVEMPGVLYGAELEPELRAASIGLVSQRADVAEFNLPSKLMNYMAYGIPVLASVRPESETARIVESSKGGWVTDAATPDQFAAAAARVLDRPEELEAAGQSAFAFAQAHFTPAAIAAAMERVLVQAVQTTGRGTRPSMSTVQDEGSSN